MIFFPPQGWLQQIVLLPASDITPLACPGRDGSDELLLSSEKSLNLATVLRTVGRDGDIRPSRAVLPVAAPRQPNAMQPVAKGNYDDAYKHNLLRDG